MRSNSTKNEVEIGSIETVTELILHDYYEASIYEHVNLSKRPIRLFKRKKNRCKRSISGRIPALLQDFRTRDTLKPQEITKNSEEEECGIKHFPTLPSEIWTSPRDNIQRESHTPAFPYPFLASKHSDRSSQGSIFRKVGAKNGSRPTQVTLQSTHAERIRAKSYKLGRSPRAPGFIRCFKPWQSISLSTLTCITCESPASSLLMHHSYHLYSELLAVVGCPFLNDRYRIHQNVCATGWAWKTPRVATMPPTSGGHSRNMYIGVACSVAGVAGRCV